MSLFVARSATRPGFRGFLSLDTDNRRRKPSNPCSRSGIVHMPFSAVDAVGVIPAAVARLSSSAPVLKGDFLSKERMIAPEGYARWKAIPPVMALQVSVGSLYAWSVFNTPLVRDIGVLASSSQDWTLSQVVPIFSTTAVCFGVSVWGLGKFIERIGPRKAGALAAVCWGGGLTVAGIGTSLHILPLIYAGYGVLGGLGFAFGYIAPVANLTTWFPDKKGLATGMALMAFGGGALVCAPLSERLFKTYQQVPECIGNVNSDQVTMEAGRTFADVGGQLKEVIVATADNVAQMPGVVEGGLYLTGTGDTGLGPTFMTLGVGYTALMMTGALTQRSPKPVDTIENSAAPTPSEPYIPLEDTTKLPQFYLMWLGVCGNAMAGVAILSCAKTMMSDIFGSTLPLYVDGAFAASYVAGLSVANLGGRLFWAASSDKIGRRNVYMTFGLLGVPIAAAIPSATAAMSADPTTMPLWAFVGASSMLVSFYGGLLGILPAYVSDTFGAKNTPSIFGRCMTGWATAALVGPRVLTYFRETDYDKALNNLAAKVDPSKFQEKFGSPIADLQEMIQAKSVTIPKLLELCPPGTVDPTVGLYDTTMYCMSGAMGAALLCNYLVKPIDPKYFVTDGKQQSSEEQKS